MYYTRLRANQKAYMTCDFSCQLYSRFHPDKFGFG